jgi:ABC-type glycerol-3-phosphate transport system substrate-binding protein
MAVIRNRQSSPSGLPTDGASPRALRRRTLLRAGLGGAMVAGAAALAACGTSQRSSDSAQPAKPSAPVEIEYWYTLPDTHPTGKARAAALAVAEAANQDSFKIRYNEATGAGMPKVVASIASGTPPNLLIDYPYYAAQLFIKGALVDYESRLKAVPAWQKARPNIAPAFQDGVRWLGNTVCVPFQISQQAMMYAPDKLDRAGLKPPPAAWTWNDFEALSKQAARPPDVWGMSVGWRSSTWQLFSGSNGVSWISKDQTKVKFTSPENYAGVEFLTRYTFGDGLLPLGSSQKTAGELLVKGQTVFEPQGPYRIPDLRTAGVTRLGAVLWPRGPQHPTAYNWGSLYSTMVFKNQDPAKERASLEAAAAVLSDEAQAAHAMTDLGLPVTKTATAAATYQRFLAGEPVVKAFVAMFPSCDVWPAIPSGDDMRNILDSTMGDLYAQRVAMATAFEAAEKQLQQIHDGYVAQTKQ